jgi:hypothetical protein
MLVEYLEGSITKQDLIVKLHEHGIDEGKFDALINLAKKGFAKGKEFFKGAQSGVGGKTGQARNAGGQYVGKGSPTQRGQNLGNAARKTVVPAAVVGGVAGINALSGDNKNDAGASPRKPVGGGDGLGMDDPKALTPKAPKPDGEQTFGQAFAAARKAQGGPGGKFSYKGKEYQTNIKGEKYVKNPTSVGPNKTLALQQRLRAAGADIKADGLMGPNTRAAMKKYGIGQSTPAAPAPAKPSTPVQPGGAGGEFATSKPAAPSTPQQTGGAGGEFAGTFIKPRNDDAYRAQNREPTTYRGRRGSTRGQSGQSGSTQSRDI